MRVGLTTLTDTDTSLDLAHELNEAGQTVVLYLSQRACLRANETPDDYINNLYDKSIIPGTCRVRMYQYPRIRDPHSIMTVRKICQDMYADGIDLAHILAGPAEPWLGVLSCLLKVPTVSTLIVPKANVGEKLNFWVEPLNRLFILGSDFIIVNGKDQIEPLQRQYRIPDGKILHVPLGARTTAVKWLSGNVCEDPGTILFFGRADLHKGLEFLVRAQPIITQRARNARILIAAHGKELDRCLDLIQDNCAFEIHAGYIPSVLMANFFTRAALVALPYISASTSGVLLTAYEFGKPVVTTNVGSLPEYVMEGVTGLLVPPGDIEGLADAVVHLLEDADLRHQMGQNARRWTAAENIKNVHKTISVYEKAMSVHRYKKDRSLIRE